MRNKSYIPREQITQFRKKKCYGRKKHGTFEKENTTLKEKFGQCKEYHNSMNLSTVKYNIHACTTLII